MNGGGTEHSAGWHATQVWGWRDPHVRVALPPPPVACKLGAHMGMGTGAPYPPAHNDNMNGAHTNPEVVPPSLFFVPPAPCKGGA